MLPGQKLRGKIGKRDRWPAATAATPPPCASTGGAWSAPARCPCPPPPHMNEAPSRRGGPRGAARGGEGTLFVRTRSPPGPQARSPLPAPPLGCRGRPRSQVHAPAHHHDDDGGGRTDGRTAGGRPSTGALLSCRFSRCWAPAQGEPPAGAWAGFSIWFSSPFFFYAINLQLVSDVESRLM